MAATNIKDKIRDFLSEGPFGVVGASKDRSKYGNKILRCYLQHALDVYPLHPRETDIEGRHCFPSIAALPKTVKKFSIIIPPDGTEEFVEEAIKAGFTHLWMQPGAESAKAIRRAEEAGISVIAGGPCLLVALGYRET